MIISNVRIPLILNSSFDVTYVYSQHQITSNTQHSLWHHICLSSHKNIRTPLILDIHSDITYAYSELNQIHTSRTYITTSQRQHYVLTMPNLQHPIENECPPTIREVTVHHGTHLISGVNWNVTRRFASMMSLTLSTNQKPRKCHDPIGTDNDPDKPNKGGGMRETKPLNNNKFRK